LFTRSPFLVFLLREIPEIMPFPVYLLRETPDMKEWLLPVALGVHFRFLLLLFSEGKETVSHPQIPFPVRRPDTGYGIPAPPSLRGAGYWPSALQSDAEFWRGDGTGKQEILLP
jgi:hypothetical protein